MVSCMLVKILILFILSFTALAEDCLYTYRAKVLSVYDGDTITVKINLGFNVAIEKMKIRLADIDAPEVKGKSRNAGLLSRDYLRERILGKDIILRTLKDKTGSFGRYIGRIYLDGKNINDELVANGYAVYRDY